MLRIGTRCSCNALFLLHANTYEIIQSEFLREFFKTIFARLPSLASAPGAARTHLATPMSTAFAVIVHVMQVAVAEWLARPTAV